MKSFHSFCYKSITILGLALLLILAVSSIFIYGHLYSSSQERMVFYKNGMVFFILIPVFFFALWKFRDLLKKVTPGKLFLICSLIYIIAGLYLTFRVPDTIRSDPYMIYKYAKKFLDADYEGLTGGYYLRFFPYQLGMVTFEMGLLSIWNSTRILFIANLILILGINFLQWRITELLSKNKLVINYSIALSFGFVPMLFYILFTYGTIPGHFFLCLGYYFLIKHIKNHSPLSFIFCGLSLGIAVIFKPNYLIAAVACAIIIFMDLLKRFSKGKLVILVIVIILSIAPNKAFLQMWRNISGVDFDGGAPYVLNVTMGLQPEEMGKGRLGGWYNGYNYDTFELNNYDIEASKKVAFEDMKNLAEHWKNNSAAARKFFIDKIHSTWNDPLFQSLWSGPLEDSDQVVTDKLLHSLFTGGHVAMVFEKYMNLVMISIYLLAAAWCFMNLTKKSGDDSELFYLLLFLGGFIFHLISETKSQYVYMYAYSLIPYAAITLCSKFGRKS
ncbi:hypothetical protein [Butyrivibrio sp. XPD2002]|uniref:hypothetical protein n=1 Tax=Butyrivibrio sp. XPD2002 TaxID=1280665 RepID=UPI00047DF3F0|nr:hypothetical protein [Butyrivibrio sp. XPD2002]